MDPIAPATKSIRPIIKVSKPQVLSTSSTPGPSPTMKTVKKLRFTDMPSPDFGDSGLNISFIPLKENASLEESLSMPESIISLKNNNSYSSDLKFSVVAQAKVKIPKESMKGSKLCQDNLLNKDCFKLFDTLESESKESCGFLKEISKKLKYLNFRKECVKSKENLIKDEKLRFERLNQGELDCDMFCENKKLPNCTSQCGIF